MQKEVNFTTYTFIGDDEEMEVEVDVCALVDDTHYDPAHNPNIEIDIVQAMHEGRDVLDQISEYWLEKLRREAYEECSTVEEIEY